MTGQEMVNFVKTKVGTPYVYGAKGASGSFTQAMLNSLANSYPDTFTASYRAKAQKFISKVCTDCSGLISWYTGKAYGSAQLYSIAYTRLPIANIKDFAYGTVLWKTGHVGIYIGMENGIPMCIEAKGIDYGTVKSKVSATNWEYGLTFSWLTYQYEVPVSGTWKGTNPYKEPVVTIMNGSKGDGVKWVQWELVEAGYQISIDGSFGPKTLEALKKFQQSSKIAVDGKCGPVTRAALKSK
ncbi:MAG: peptidoglycan-binding protein [Lachnospiraceae bacterium]|nr:peptidoglycan-binding protein [Lachnospiraceae bacterium]